MLLWMAWQRQAKQPTTSLNGLTVRQLLDVANTLLGAGASTFTIAEVAPIVSDVTASFISGTPSTFAQEHLVNGACP